MNFSNTVLSALAKLRPPFARSAALLYPYSAAESNVNPGISYLLPFGETVRAAGAGTVLSANAQAVNFFTKNTSLAVSSPFSVVIDHGNGIVTGVSGLEVANVALGQQVNRGDLLGTTSTGEIFFSASVSGKRLNPMSINPHFSLQNGNEVTGQTGMVRFSPDTLLRDLSQGVTALFFSGIRYFVGASLSPFLLNIDFNGNGTKIGPAVAGFGPTDYWNVYAPVTFLATPNSGCYITGAESVTFNLPQVLPLLDYKSNTSPVVFERLAPILSAAGSNASFDPMLATYMGDGEAIPTFNLRNIPPGQYTLYLYTNQAGGTLFYIWLNGVYVGAPAFVQPAGHTVFDSSNTLSYTFTVTSSLQVLSIGFEGYISGLQLLNT